MKTTADDEFRASSLLNGEASRRDFVKVAAGSLGVAGLGVFGGVRVLGGKATDSTVYMPKAKMMVVHDPSRCVGCRRCEMACSLFHDNKASIATSRIKLSRNYNFGPEGPRVGWTHGEGIYGNHRLVADTCLQCPHPVACATACPQQAIGVSSKTGARVIDTKKCVGCGICTKACPWGMPTLDKEVGKSTKCDLCGGNPQCVAICPSGALSYVPWADRSSAVPPRQVVPAYVQPAAGVEDTCGDCHTGVSNSSKK
jgi:Fe-S-cluster-containing dehydrogenase component